MQLLAVATFETMQAMFESEPELDALACYTQILRSLMTVPPNSADDEYTQCGRVGWRLGRHMMIVGVKDSRAAGEG